MITQVYERVHDAVRRLQCSPTPLLNDQGIGELIRADSLQRRWGQESFYVLSSTDGEVTGLLPGYVTWARATRRAQAVLGSEGVKPSTLTVRPGYPYAARLLTAAAIDHAARYDPECVQLPQLDDQQFAAVAPQLPTGFSVTVDHDTAIATKFTSFDDYASALTRNGRKRLRRETRAFQAAGFAVEPMDPVDVTVLAPLLRQVQVRHHAGLPVQMLEIYLASLMSTFGEGVQVLAARSGGRLVAFQLMCDMGQEWWVRCFGCDYGNDLVGTSYVYFNLAIYEPVRQAIRSGARRVCLGPGSLEAKVRRGATLRTLRTITLSGDGLSPG